MALCERYDRSCQKNPCLHILKSAYTIKSVLVKSPSDFSPRGDTKDVVGLSVMAACCWSHHGRVSMVSNWENNCTGKNQIVGKRETRGFSDSPVPFSLRSYSNHLGNRQRFWHQSMCYSKGENVKPYANPFLQMAIRSVLLKCNECCIAMLERSNKQHIRLQQFVSLLGFKRC